MGRVSKAKQVEYEQKLERVAMLVKGRVPYREIAQNLNCSPAGVCKMMKKLMARWREKQMDNINEQALIDLETTDDAIRAITNAVRSGDFHAIDRLVKLMEHRAKILGLSAPTKVAPTDPTGKRRYHDIEDLTDDELLALVEGREKQMG